MDSKQFVIAYDLGTSGVKVALVSMEGDVLATSTANYPLYVEHEGWAEQDPELYWDRVCQVTKAVIAKSALDPANAAGMAFSTMWKGIIPVDKDGKVLHHSIIWLDCRSVEQAARLNTRFGEGRFAPSDYWPKLLWLKDNKPEILEQAEMVLEVNSFLKWKATGVAAVDISNNFIHSFDDELDNFYTEVMDFCGIDKAKFPKWVDASDFVGNVTESAAEELGLVPGIPVYAGCSDISAIAIGSGCTKLGHVHLYFGSSGWVGHSLPHSTKELFVSPFDTVRDISIDSMQAIGLAFNWVVDRLYGHEKEVMGDGVYDFINEEIAQIPAGSDGVIATPWFYGERQPILSENSRGSFMNLAATHDRRHMARSILESICYTLKMRCLYRKKKTGEKFPPEVLHAVGGGSASDPWMQMLADIMNVPVCVPYSPRHAGAVGTAYCVFVGLGVCESLDESGQSIKIERRFEPRSEVVKAYEAGFAAFLRTCGLDQSMEGDV